MNNIVFIETPRLILRTVTEKDVDAVASSWELGKSVLSHEEAQAKINWMLDNHEKNAPQNIVHLCLAIIDKGSDEFIGWCGLDHRNRKNEFPVLSIYCVKVIGVMDWERKLPRQSSIMALAK